MTLRIHPTEIVRQSQSPLLSVHPSWSRVPLGDIAEVSNGFAFKSEFFDEGEGVPLLRIRDVGRSATETRYSGQYAPSYIVRPGEIVVGMDGDFRIDRWRGPEALLNQRVCKVVPRDQSLYDEAFLLYVLPGYLNAIHDFTSSVTVKHLSSESVKEIPLPLPPLVEQRRIVAAIEELFSRIDAGGEALQRARRNLKRMRAAVVQAAVTARLVPQDPSDEPAALLLRRVLEQRQAAWSVDGNRGRYPQPDEPEGELGDLPSGWAWTTVDQLAVRIDYGTSARCSTDLKGGVPVLRMGNIQDGELNFSDLKYLPNDHPEVESLLLLDGDILFNRTNSPELVGKSAVFRSLSRPVIFASYLIRLRLSPLVDPRWISLFINGPIGRSYVAAVRVQQVGQANVNATKLAAMPITLPPAPEQRRILDEVDRQLSAIKALDSLASRAELHAWQLKRGILARGFAGRLVSQDPSDEPAAILLDRIRVARAANDSAFHRTRRELRR